MLFFLYNRQSISMTVDRYSHCFTKTQLQHIIDGYLGLRPYYVILIKILKEYTQRHEQLADMHNKDKPHPIRIYSKDSLCSKNVLDDFCDLQLTNEGTKLCQLRSTYNCISMQFFYIYNLEIIVDLLKSQSFYKEIPKDIIVNNLLTATNVQIIIQTLNIVSEDMSRKIKTTLAGKHSKINKDIHGRKTVAVPPQNVELWKVIQEIEEHQVIQQSTIDMGNQKMEQLQKEDDDGDIEVIEFQPNEKDIKKTDIFQGEPLSDCKTYKRYKTSFMRLERNGYQTDCSYCRDYLFYLNQITNFNLSAEYLNSLSKQSLRCLRLISQTVTHFTLYLMETNQIEIPNDIHVINRVLNSIGIVITEDIFASELNPKIKAKRKPESLLIHPKNLIEELQPYFWTVDSKGTNDSFYRVDQLFRMIVYCPTTEEVAQQLRNYQIDLFQKQKSSMRSVQKDQKMKLLLKQQCSNMRLYEQQRLKIITDSVNFKPVYKQLQFEQEKIVIPKSVPRYYNGYRPSTSSALRRSGCIKTCSSIGVSTKGAAKGHQPNENKSIMSQLAHNLSKSKVIHHKASDKMEQIIRNTSESKTIKESIKKEWHQARVNTMIANQSSIENMSVTIKKNFISNQTSSRQKISKPGRTDQSFNCIKIEATQSNQELSERHFKRMINNAYLRNKNSDTFGHFILTAPRFVSSASPSFSLSHNTVFQKSNIKKINTYSNSLSQLMGRKQEEEQMQCMEKKEKQIFHKQLLNGKSVKDQIYEEIRTGAAKVYQGLNSISEVSEDHFHVLNNKTVITGNNIKVGDLKAKYGDKKKIKRTNRGHKKSGIVSNKVACTQSGLIRNQKYSKSIKNQLINNRNSFLQIAQKQNNLKIHKISANKLKNDSPMTECIMRQIYQQELKRVLKNS